MSYEILPQDEEHSKKLMEIRNQLLSGPKTWTELAKSLKMSKRTLAKCLFELQKRGEVEKIGIIEGNKSKVVYRLDSTSKKIYEIFEETQHWFFPIRVKEDLDIEQEMVRWFYDDIWAFMHVARKIMQIKNEVSDKRKAQQYIKEWIAFAMRKASENMKDSLKWIAEKGEKSWINIFGKYEDDPEPFIKGLWKYAEIIKKAKERREKEIEREIKEGKIKQVSLRGRELKKKKEVEW